MVMYVNMIVVITKGWNLNMHDNLFLLTESFTASDQVELQVELDENGIIVYIIIIILLIIVGHVTLEKVLYFFTGTEIVPVTGFDDVPVLNFSHSNKYPTASTCAIELTLPARCDNYPSFKQNMDVGMLNHGGFGLL